VNNGKWFGLIEKGEPLEDLQWVFTIAATLCMAFGFWVFRYCPDHPDPHTGHLLAVRSHGRAVYLQVWQYLVFPAGVLGCVVPAGALGLYRRLRGR
jgi:hypothetical protein